MSAWYDFDKSGGFNLGDIGAGISQGVDSIQEGLFGRSTPTVSNRGNSYVNMPDTANITTNGLIGTGGNFDFNQVKETGSNLMNLLGENKNAITAGAGLFNTYANYQGMKNQQDYAKRLIGLQELEMKKNIQDEAMAREAFNAGHGNRVGLLNDEKKKATTSYYGV